MCPIFNGYGDTAISISVTTKVHRFYSFTFLSVGMDEKRSLQRKSKHKRRIGRSHYEQCCPPEVRTPR
jgi:hypothetical protein